LRCHERLSKKAVIVEANVGNTDDEGVLRYKRNPIRNLLLGGRDRPDIWTTVIADTFDTFFNNDNSDDKCGVESCKLMAPGCGMEAVSDTTQLVKKSGKWALQAHLDRPYGYIEHFCIKCTNSDSMYDRQSITYDNYRIQLPSKCTYAMEQKSDANLDPIIYVHDDAEVGDKVFANGFDQFFVNVGGRHGIDNNI